MSARDAISQWRKNTLRLMAHRAEKVLPEQHILCLKLSQANPNFYESELSALKSAIERESQPLKERLAMLRDLEVFIAAGGELLSASKKFKNLPKDSGEWTWPGR